MIRLRRKEKGADFYDKLFRESESYNLHYKDSQYYPLWAAIIRHVRQVPNPKILEVGCGTGQLAHFLSDEGFRNYHGFDISEEAVTRALQRIDQSFAVGNALDASSFDHEYNILITTEVLEHIEDDLAVLNHIREGTHIIFSVPSFDSASHVRHFRTPWSVYSRYAPFVKKLCVVVIWKLYICYGTFTHSKPTGLNRLFKIHEKITLKSLPITMIRSAYHRINRYSIFNR